MAWVEALKDSGNPMMWRLFHLERLFRTSNWSWLVKQHHVSELLGIALHRWRLFCALFPGCGAIDNCGANSFFSWAMTLVTAASTAEKMVGGGEGCSCFCNAAISWVGHYMGLNWEGGCNPPPWVPLCQGAHHADISRRFSSDILAEITPERRSMRLPSSTGRLVRCIRAPEVAL